MTTASSDGSAAERSLWDENVQGLGNVLMNVRQAWYGDDGHQAVFYTKERERLAKYLPPFYYGMAASAFLFVGFRVTGSARVQQWRQRVWSQWSKSSGRRGGGGTVETANPRQPATPTPSMPQPGMGYLETKRIVEREKALQSMKLITDFLVSISVGVSGTLFMLEGQKMHMRSDYEEAPLVAGRSVVADQMCSSLLELRRNNQAVRVVLEESESDDTDHPDVNMRSFARFIRNCQKRADFEAGIRKVKGMSRFDPVVVSYTGL